jgi:hypothetical protein
MSVPVESQVALYAPARISAARVAHAAAIAAGCTCRPDVEIRGDVATVRHDSWCALLRRDDKN